MPPEGIKLVRHEDTLSFDEITEFVRYAVSAGIDKVRITGGEPLVRKGIVSLIEMIARIKGIKDLSMTTNGVLLDKFAKDLATAGLQRVNISLDSINEDNYRKITRSGDVNMVFDGIRAAKNAGLTPIKINCVIKESPDEPDAIEVAEYCKANDLQLRFIPEMDLETGHFGIVQGGTGGDCIKCNRLRLTATGDVLPCLFSDEKFNVRELGIENAFKQALIGKPESGCFAKDKKFYNIGG